MEGEPFNDQDYTDEQLVALLAMKGQYAEGHGILSEREIKQLKFQRWLSEHGVLDEFGATSPTEAA